MKNFLIYGLLCVGMFLSSCKSDRLDINVSDVPLPEISVDRLEQDLFKIDTSKITTETEKLKTKYGHFYTIFIKSIINNGGLRDSLYTNQIKQFVSDRDMREAYSDCQKVFPSPDTLNEQLTDLFKHFKYYFPDKNIPKPITMMSGFNYSVVMLDSTLAIGLEMYLGSANKFYKMLALPNYKTMFMNKENIMPDAARAWITTEFPYNMNKSDFLSEITYMGKILYLTDALLPKVHDTLKIKYTREQLEYCTQNEFNVWSYFAAQKLLYTTNQNGRIS